MKKASKRQIAVVFEVVTMIGYLSVRSFPAQEQSASPMISTKDETRHMQVYMVDSDKALVPLSVPIGEETSEEDKLALAFSYMSGRQETRGFTPLLTKKCTLQSSSIKNGIVSLYSDDSLRNYNKENEPRILGTVTWGAMQFHDIEQVKLHLNDEQLTGMPSTQTPIPEILNRSIGINHFKTSATTLHNSASLMVFYTKEVQGNEHMVSENEQVVQSQGGTLRASIEDILSDISISNVLDRPLYVDDIRVSSFDVYDDSLTVNLNKNILASNRTVKQDVYNALVLSLAALPGIEKIEVYMDGVTVSLKDQKEDIVPVHALTHNEVQSQCI